MWGRVAGGRGAEGGDTQRHDDCHRVIADELPGVVEAEQLLELVLQRGVGLPSRPARRRRRQVPCPL
jgi:hypothetical protein